MITALVEYELEQHIVILTLNDEKRRNGLSPEMVDALIDALQRATEADARCIVLTGKGGTFSSGGNPRRMLAPGLYPDMTTVEIRRFYQQGIQRLPQAFAALDIPVIAAINGAAIGAGCDLTCMCDIRIASQEASFASSFVKLGIIPGDGGAWLLPRVVGLSQAMDMMLTGASLDAEQAKNIGLVSAVAAAQDLMPVALEKARAIAANPPHAVQLAKRLILQCQTTDLNGALQLSAAMQSMAHKTDDHREAVEALLAQRQPNFTGK